MRGCRLTISAGLAIFLLVGCGSDSDPAADATVDVLDDMDEADSEVDTGVDVEADTTPPVDAGMDVEDAAVDLPLDAPVDAPADLPLDAAADVAVDTAVDTAIDIAVDTAIDTAADTAVDTAVDTGVDTAVDLAVDTGVDVGSDAVQGQKTLTMLSASASTGNLPDPRRKAAIAYDSQGDRMLVYGGEVAGTGGDVVDDIWAYDLDPAVSKPWDEIKPDPGTDGPPFGRYAATAFIDTSRDRLIVGGGGAWDYILDDSWYLELTPAGSETWMQISAADPYGFLGGEIVAYDAANDRVVLVNDAFCAFDSGMFGAEVRQVDLTTDTGSSLSPTGTAPSFYCGIGVNDTLHHRMVVIGGTPNTIHALSLTAGSEAWAPITATGTQPPTFSTTAAAVATTPTGHVYMYVLGTTWNKIWRLDLTTMGSESWTQLPLTGTPPAGPRIHFGLIHDASRNRLVIFGGSDDSATTYYNDVWEISNID